MTHIALSCLLSLSPAPAAASQCPPNDVCEVTVRVLSVREGPADEQGISTVEVGLRILSVGRMVEKNRFMPTARTCAQQYKKGQKIKINRVKESRKGPKDRGNDPAGLEVFKPGAVLRGDIQYGCDERMSWYGFENVAVLRSAAPAAPRRGAGAGAKPGPEAEPAGPPPPVQPGHPQPRPD